MASDAPSTILLQINGAERRPQDGIANVPLTPGEFIKREANGNFSPEDGAGLPRVCIEKAPIDPGTVTTKAIDTDWSVGETFSYITPQRGDVVYGFLAAGQNVIADAPLEGDGTGAFTALNLGVLKCYAAEAVDNSGGGSRVRIKLIVA